MTGNAGKIEVPVEWAWQGKEPDDRGYRLLACSNGNISAGNFEEILDRFAPGTLEKLPQVTVSYVPGRENAGYLSMGFHEEAAGGLDRLGRDVTFTRFFSAPYRQLAAGAVSYLAMYQALERVRLPDTAAPPFTAEFARPAATIPGDAMRALPVAQLLLTGNPVCIVDAESTSMAERLAYIDAVMSLLPYGMRAEMAAATWTSSTYRLHKFRLFFSEAPRRAPESGVDDHVVRWRHDAMAITRAPKTRIPQEYGDEYRQWLQPLLEGPSVTTELAQETTARAFKAADINQMLDGIHAKHQKRIWIRPSRRREAANNVATNAEVPVQPPRPQDPRPERNGYDLVESLIERIAAILNSPAADPRAVGPCLDRLRQELASAPPGDDARERYQARIATHRLLRDGLPIANNKKTGFYKLLLRAAFGPRIGYIDYCVIERMIGGKTPDKSLLQAIDEMLGADQQVDLRAVFLVQFHLKKAKHVRSEFSAAQLLMIVADPQLREEHARPVWDATKIALRAARAAEFNSVILPLLRDRGFLALDLQARAPTDLTYQVNALRGLLEAAYPDGLRPDDFPGIFAGSQRYHPTLALLLAVCPLTAHEDVGDTLAGFLHGLAQSLAVPGDVRGWLDQLDYQPGPMDSDPGQTVAAAGEVPPTRLDMPSSTTEAATYLDSLRPADPARKKPGRWGRLLHPSGEFPMTEKKSQSGDGR